MKPARSEHAWRWKLVAGWAALTCVLLSTLDGRSRGLLANTITLMACVAIIAVPWGTALAVLLARTDLPLRGWFVAPFAWLAWAPLFVQAGGWQAGFGLQGWLTMRSQSAPVLEGWPAVIWIHSLAALPWVIACAAAGLWMVEPELEEQATVETSAGAALWHVTLPRARPALVVAALWVAVTCGQEMTVTDLFQIRTFAEELYNQAVTESSPEPLTTWPSILLSAWLGGLGLLVVAWIPVRRSPRSRPSRVFSLGGWRWPAFAFVLLSAVVAVGVPVFNLIYKAGLSVEFVTDHYERAWSSLKAARMITEAWVRYDSAMGAWRAGRFLRETGWSLGIGALAASVVVFVAIPIAWWARRGAWRAALLALVVAMGLTVPGPAWGLVFAAALNSRAAISLGEAIGFDLYTETVFPLVLLQALRGMPLAVLSLWSTWRMTPRALEEVATLEGAGPLDRLWLLAITPHWRLLAIAWLAALALALGELGGSVLIVPPRATLLSVQIFAALHWGQEDQVAGVCLAALLMSGALVAIGHALARKAVFK